MRTFKGYRRPDGSVGTRNHIAIISTVACANPVAQQIAQDVPGCVALIHGHGCGRVIEKEMFRDCLAGFANNANVYGTVLVSLGCEGLDVAGLVEKIKAGGKPFEFIRIQDGGSNDAIMRGKLAAQKMASEAALQEREEFPVSALLLGTECGGSDALSGVTANPTIGLLSDWLCEQGGGSILTETTELMGCNHILKKRARNEEVARRIDEVIQDAVDVAKDHLGENAARAIAPGNMDGGMSTIQEKALGCVRKGGSSQINEVCGYGVKPTQKGLVIMDGPGYDVESISGMAAMGAQVIIFSSGRGNPIGFPIVPVIKIGSNDDLYERMPDNIDVNAGMLLHDGFDFPEMKEYIVDYFIRVASGELTKAERNNCGGIVCFWTESKAM